MNLKIKIEENEKAPKFSLSKYEFVVLINSSINSNKNSHIIGRVYAIPNKSFERIYYQIIENKNKNEIEINSLTGELTFIFNEKNDLIKNNEIEINVEASILSKNNSLSKYLISKTKVKIYFRFLNFLNEILFKFQINLLKENQIIQLNNSNSFIIDQNIKINQNLFNISINSFYYPLDQFILSLDNYLHLFSFFPSSNFNHYILKTRQHLLSTSIYLLNISVKHKLSQQWLPNLKLELIIIDQWTTTTTTNNKQIITNQTTNEIITSTNLKLINQSLEFCLENQSYILYHLNQKKKNQIGLFKVIKSNSTLRKNHQKKYLSIINEKELIIDECQMSIDKLNKSLNKSLEYQLCSYSFVMECYNITIKLLLTTNSNPKGFFSMNLVEIMMLILSLIFFLITILLVFVICRLNDFDLCLKLRKNIFNRKKSNLNNIEQQLSPFSLSSRNKVCLVFLFLIIILIKFFFRKE